MLISYVQTWGPYSCAYLHPTPLPLHSLITVFATHAVYRHDQMHREACHKSASSCSLWLWQAKWLGLLIYWPSVTPSMYTGDVRVQISCPPAFSLLRSEYLCLFYSESSPEIRTPEPACRAPRFPYTTSVPVAPIKMSNFLCCLLKFWNRWPDIAMYILALDGNCFSTFWRSAQTMLFCILPVHGHFCEWGIVWRSGVQPFNQFWMKLFN